MADQGRPEQRPGDEAVVQFQIRRGGGLVQRIKYIRMSKFNSYGYLEWYLLEICDNRDGADFLDITYTRYGDANNIERRLGSEPWEDFAATVHQILIRRV